nr:MAG TPA: hypothetical protein [Caudoviricetes sp.]
MKMKHSPVSRLTTISFTHRNIEHSLSHTG